MDLAKQEIIVFVWNAQKDFENDPCASQPLPNFIRVFMS